MSDSIIKLFQIDAFTSEIFKGNPACVMPLENWLSDDILLKIAKESAEEANMMGKLTSLYQVLNDVQKRINDIEANLA